MIFRCCHDRFTIINRIGDFSIVIKGYLVLSLADRRLEGVCIDTFSVCIGCFSCLRSTRVVVDDLLYLNHVVMLVRIVVADSSNDFWYCHLLPLKAFTDCFTGLFVFGCHLLMMQYDRGLLSACCAFYACRLCRLFCMCVTVSVNETVHLLSVVAGLA